MEVVEIGLMIRIDGIDGYTEVRFIIICMHNECEYLLYLNF